MKSNSKTKAKALKTTRAAALITAAVLALLFIGCQNAVKTKLVVQISLFCFYW